MYEQASENPVEYKPIALSSMNSRVSLSILAAVTGAALMYVFITFFNIPIETEHTMLTRIAVLVGLGCVAAGWVKIYWRRPSPRSSIR